MPSTWDNSTPQEREKLAKQWLETCLDPGQLTKKLTAWEANFLESLDDQLGRGRIISEKQFEILERIYADKTA